MPRYGEHTLCEPCEAAVSGKVLASAIVGIPAFGVGAVLTSGVASAMCVAAWEYKEMPGKCARCGADFPPTAEAEAPPPAASAYRKPQSLSTLAEKCLPALEATRTALEKQPRDATDPAVIPHVLQAMWPDVKAFFERSGGASSEDPLHMAHSREDRGQWELKLTSPPDFVSSSSRDSVFLVGSQARHDFERETQKRIAVSLDIAPDRVQITDVKKGSVIVQYTVLDLAAADKERILKEDDAITKKLRRQFDTFADLQISPAVFALCFDLDQLDQRGNKTFNTGSTFKIGPPGKERTYHQPTGWVRYGFKVLGKYETDTWLQPFQSKENWYRAFHGTGRSSIGGPKAARTILSSGFKRSTGGAIGPGVYVTPHVSYAEAGYTGTVQVNTLQGMKKFKFVLQVAANPKGILNEGIPDANRENREWTLKERDVRPYGLLIKEM